MQIATVDRERYKRWHVKKYLYRFLSVWLGFAMQMLRYEVDYVPCFVMLDDHGAQWRWPYRPHPTVFSMIMIVTGSPAAPPTKGTAGTARGVLEDGKWEHLS